MTVASQEPSPVTDTTFKTAVEGAEEPRTNGTPLATLLAAGVGVFMLGVFTTFAVISVDFKNALVIDKGVGPLSGKTVYEVVAWLIAWGVGYAVMRGRNYEARPFYIVTFVLIALGFLGTFPIFFDLFAPK